MTAADKPIRVLVVDDSAFARKVLREALSQAAELEVVGIARDGLEALEKIAELEPDVVTLDLVMPNLDGLGVLRALPPAGGPRVVVVSISDADSALGIEALQRGATDLVHKPTALATDRLYELSAELVEKVINAARSRKRVIAPPAQVAALPAAQVGARTSPVRLVVVGTSTGGPQALTRLLNELPRDLPCAVAVALHIPAGYTEALARRLDDSSAVRVFEAWEGAEIAPGSVAIARGGAHLRVSDHNGVLTAHVSPKPVSAKFCPSVDILFDSAASLGAATLGVVLTGMGDDGLAGARAIHAAGGRILTESESSCVVYGMPRAVHEAGLSSGEAPIEAMAAAILRNI
jgi:two-component system chemotaxis response regulator CheB